MKSEAKSIVSWNNKYESFMIEKSTKNYDSIKSRQKSVWGIIDETYKDVEWYKKEWGKFDDIYGEWSYSASLLKYVLSGKELKVKDWKLDEEIKKKLSISDTTFSQIDLSK
jgi:hypothetical protein